MKPISRTKTTPALSHGFDGADWYAFELGREWKLSLAEIEALFGRASILWVSPKLCVIKTKQDVAKIAARMGGIVRAFKMVTSLRDARSFPSELSKQMENMPEATRITFGLGAIGVSSPIFSQGLRLKKELKSKGFTVRLVNKDDNNLVSAVVKKEGLIATGTEFFLLECEKKLYLSRTIHIQDIDAYAERDLGKSRDMVVGMLPPKLAQTMINLAIGSSLIDDKIHIYDPFCGLGTVPIESLYMGISQIYASDVSPEMTTATSQSVAKYLAGVFGVLDSVTHLPVLKIEILDARGISNFPYISDVTHIVTEGYLGRIFGQSSIKPELVDEEKANLLNIYESMFEGLANIHWSGTIVMTIPCWETREGSMYFGEFYQMIRKHGYQADSLLTDSVDVKLTKYGSLIYRRPGQTVGREVIRIRKHR